MRFWIRNGETGLIVAQVEARTEADALNSVDFAYGYDLEYIGHGPRARPCLAGFDGTFYLADAQEVAAMREP